MWKLNKTKLAPKQYICIVSTIHTALTISKDTGTYCTYRCLILISVAVLRHLKDYKSWNITSNDFWGGDPWPRGRVACCAFIRTSWDRALQYGWSWRAGKTTFRWYACSGTIGYIVFSIPGFLLLLFFESNDFRRERGDYNKYQFGQAAVQPKRKWSWCGWGG